MLKKKIEKKAESPTSISNIYRLWGWVLLIWSLYRYFLKFPEWVDELIFKPVVFVLPVIWFVR